MKVSFKHNFLNILTGWKNKSHTALSGVWKFWGYLWSEFRLKKDKWCKFISDTVLQNTPRLQQSFLHTRQSISRYHSEWCITYQDSIFYVSIFLVSGKREGEERERETPPSLHYYFLLFSSRVYCHVIKHRGLFSHEKLERVVLEPNCSKLTDRTRFNRKI